MITCALRTFGFLLATLVLFFLAGCDEKNEPSPAQVKLDYYIDSFEGSGLEGKSKVEYKYDATGVLERYTIYTYNSTTNAFDKQRHFELSYQSSRLDKIKGYEVNSSMPSIEYTYTYNSDSRINSINEYNVGSQLNGLATFNYVKNDSIIVSYQYSNGGSFEYHIRSLNSNIMYDRTTRGSQLCSKGQYTYDQGINPLSKLGYVDFSLLNLSVNNRLTENVSYVGCVFPSFIPESYEYEYDNNMPAKRITRYRSNTQIKSVRSFFYKTI